VHAPCYVTCRQGGPKWPYIWNSRGHIVYSIYNFYGPTMTIRGCVVQAIARENPPGGLTCRLVNKKGIYTLEKFLSYFTHLPRSPQWTDLWQTNRRTDEYFWIMTTAWSLLKYGQLKIIKIWWSFKLQSTVLGIFFEMQCIINLHFHARELA